MKRMLLTALTGCCLIASPLSAHDGARATVPVKAADVYRPSAVPDRIILTWAGDPRTTQAVTWRTSTDVKLGIAELALADAGPNFSQQARRTEAQTQVLVTDINEAHFHTVHWRNLKPATKYAYRVGDGTNWSEWFHFNTANDKPEAFSFIYFGDAQNDIRSLWSRVIREAYSDAPKAKFMIHAGDLINNAETDAEWGEWFGAGGWLNAMMPSVPVPGNHEIAKLQGETRLSHHWRPQFALPANGPFGLEETCYTFEYQNVRFVCMNSNEDLESQTHWLDQVLAGNNSRWVICTFHHPVFSTGKDRDNPKLRAAWKPIFDKYKVDLVLQGHDHSYGRTGLQVPTDPATAKVLHATGDNVPTGVQAVEPETGTVYVVSVSGPKMYENNRHSFMKRLAEDTQLYQIITVDGDCLKFEAKTATGELYDAFNLKKRTGQINSLEEVPPATEQRLRPPKTPTPTVEAVGTAVK